MATIKNGHTRRGPITPSTQLSYHEIMSRHAEKERWETKKEKPSSSKK